MMRLRLELITEDGQSKSIERTSTVSSRMSSERSEFVMDQLLFELNKNARQLEIYRNLPSTKDFIRKPKPKRQPRLRDYFHRINADPMWLEITNTMSNIKFHLAQAKAYRESEPKRARSRSKAAFNHLVICHFAKMSELNEAIAELVRIQDLVVYLLFEAFGRTLVRVKDFNDPEIKLREIRDALKKKADAGEVSRREYAEIDAALTARIRSKQGKLLVAYRNRLIHRLRPSVDHRELYTLLNRHEVFFDATGKIIRREAGFGTGRKPEFRFATLYAAAVGYFSQTSRMLVRLKKVSRLA